MKNSLYLSSLLMIGSLGHAGAASIANPSFETDDFNAFPGYISVNGGVGVTDWAHTADAQQGLNKAGNTPFANNGAYPDGNNVAFIQTNANTNSFSNTITGLTSGQQYELSYRVTARESYATPQMTLSVGGTQILGSNVTAVGGTNDYGWVVQTFTATSGTMPFSITSSTATDGALVLDDFQISLKTSNPWSVSAWTGDADSGVSSSLSYTHAYNFGAATDATVNGVLFTGVAGANPTGTNFSVVGIPNSLADATNNINAGGSALLADDFIYGGNPSSLTLTGLVDGQAYRTSIFGVGWVDANNPYRTSTFEANGDRLSIEEQQFGDDNGIRVDYEFVASGTSQVINVDALGADSFHTYAFANAAIPEPSGVLLVGLGLTSVFLRRRR